MLQKCLCNCDLKCGCLQVIKPQTFEINKQWSELAIKISAFCHDFVIEAIDWGSITWWQPHFNPQLQRHFL